MNHRTAVLLLLMTLLLSCHSAVQPSENAKALQIKAGEGDKAALSQLKALGNKGDADAQYNLGVMYATGDGVPKDAVQAVSWYRKAAEQGHALAQGNLGFMYATGDGVPKDFVTAYMWRNLAAAQGGELDKTQRDGLEKYMTPAQIAEAQKLSREWRPPALDKNYFIKKYGLTPKP